MNTDKLARGMLAALAIWFPWAAYTRPQSLASFYKSVDGMAGTGIMLALALAGVLILIDIVFNSGRERKLWPLLTRFRAHLYLTVMVLSVVTPFTASRYDLLHSSGFFPYIITFISAGCLCWIDTAAKWRATACFR